MRKTLPLKRKKKILLVDDEQDLVSSLAGLLQDNGYDVVSASNGLEGLKKAEEDRPDLILLDIMMPKVDGYEVLRTLKISADISDIPVIMISARPETDSILRTLNLRAVDYFIKPFNSTDLLKSIEKYA